MLTLVHTGLLLDSDAEPTPPSIAQRQQWTAATAGCVTAALAAWFLIPISLLLQPSPFVIFISCCLFLALTAGAGFLGTWLAQLTQPAALPCGAAHLSRYALLAWFFFPSIALLCHHRSPLALLAAAVASIALTLGLRPLFAPTEDAQPPRIPTQFMPSLCGLPASDSNPSEAVFIALSAIGALVCVCNLFLFAATVLLAASLALPAWRWSAFSPNDALRRPSVRYATAALAVLLTILANSPITFGSGFWPFTGHKHFTLYPAHSLGLHKGIDRDYVSIILLPPPAKKTRIIPPPPNSSPGSATAKSIVIPFDGAYWYFQQPAAGPGVHAHTVHGQPTAADIRSTTVDALAMEAHQTLDIPIDLSCCRAINLTITNADTRPGPIALRMSLADSSARQTMDLGRMIVRSSAALPIDRNRAPVRETLHFLIPASKSIDRFDRITVTYLPSAARSRIGAKVSVDSFTLVPR